MPEIPPRQLRFRLWIFVVPLVVVPILLTIVLSVLSKTNAIRTDQRRPPTDIMSLKPITTSNKKDLSQTDYKQFLATFPNQSAAELYQKCTDHNNFFWDGWRSPKWAVTDTHFKAEYVAVNWLRDHKEFIGNLIKLAQAGGFPTTTCEQAAGAEKHRSFPIPDTRVDRPCRTLIAESRLRRGAGDMAGAAEALMAAYTLARSVSEPMTIMMVIAAERQIEANQELAAWIGDGTLEPGLTRRMSEHLISTQLTLEQYRHTVEIEYLSERERLIEYLESPIDEIYGARMSGSMRGVQDANIFYAMGSYGKAIFQSACGAAYDKSSASQQVGALDEEFRQSFERIEKDLPSALTTYKYGFNEENSRAYVKLNIAYMRVNVAALDTMTSATTQIDPFGRKPLRRVEDTSETLIYSIGPDLIDQRGAVLCDPAMKADTPGDIAVRIPRR